MNTTYPPQELYGAASARLLKYSADEQHGPSDLTSEPDVLESMPEQPDATTMVLRVRQNARYHDKEPVNGRAFTAEDVKFSFDRYMSIGQSRAQLEAITNIDVTDDFTLTLTLGRPSASLTSAFADSVMLWMIAPEVGEEEIGPTTPIVGVGPFIFDSYQTEVQTNFVRNPDYFLEGLPYVERLERPVIPQEATADANFRSGDLVRLSITDKDRLDDLMSQVSDATRQDYFSWAMIRIDPATHLAPFDDVDMRRALSLAVDRDSLGLAMGLIDFKYGSHAFGAGYTPWFVDPQSSDFGESARWFEFDPAEAKAIVDAKYPDGVEAEYHLASEYAGSTLIGEYLSDKYAQVGVRLNIRSYSYVEYQNKFRANTSASYKNWEGMIDERFASRADPTGWFLSYHAPTASRGMTKFEDTDFERMIADQEAELDLESRIQLVWEIQRHMADRMWGVPLLSDGTVELNQPRLKDYIHKAGAGRSAEGMLRAWIEEA